MIVFFKSYVFTYFHEKNLMEFSTCIYILDSLIINTVLYDFIDRIFNLSGNFTSVNPANSLIEKWQTRALHPLLDPETVWDNVITNR